jgi:hypothetical protein
VVQFVRQKTADDHGAHEKKKNFLACVHQAIANYVITKKSGDGRIGL